MRIASALLGAVLVTGCGDDDAEPPAVDASSIDGAVAVDGAAAVDGPLAVDAPAPLDAPGPDATVTCGFVDWTAAPAGGPATGTLGTATITLTGDSLGPSSNVDGSVTVFADVALHDPPVATSDAIDVRGLTPAASYTLSFGGPASDVRIYLASFASIATFERGVVLQKRSGDANLVVDGNVATGELDDIPGGYDTNGIVDVTGTVDTLTFTMAYTPPPDGIYFQVYACR